MTSESLLMNGTLKMLGRAGTLGGPALGMPTQNRGIPRKQSQIRNLRVQETGNLIGARISILHNQRRTVDQLSDRAAVSNSKETNVKTSASNTNASSMANGRCYECNEFRHRASFRR